MLEDLDILSERIAKVVQLAKKLQSEREEMLQRIAELERDYSSLQAQQLRDNEEFTSMSAKVASHQQELKAVQDQAVQLRADLQNRYEEQKYKSENLQTDLNKTADERDNLRVVATQAQQQIDLILERLPGAGA